LPHSATPKNTPRTDSIGCNALLAGIRIFALALDEKTTVAKVSQGFDSIASNEDLILKVTSKSLSNLPLHKLFELFIKDNFRQCKQFEMTQVFKG
jgi:hypothetical protein